MVPKKPKMTFIQAAKKNGYMQKGRFKPLPKKGTAEYNKIKAQM